MNQQEVQRFVERYLHALDCQVIKQGHGYVTSKLSIQADQDIGGRPFYWHFQEKTGAEPEPLTLTFIFNQKAAELEGVKGEWIQFGSWRLHQMFQSAKKHGRYVRLYEQVNTLASTRALIPWLFINYRISLKSDQKKDIFYPLGMNLVTGQIIEHFDSILDQYCLTPKIPDYHFTMPHIFSLSSAIKHIETHVVNMMQELDDSWANEANMRLDEEIEIIHSFYVQEQTEDDTLQNRLLEVEYYRPRIEAEAINVGIVYLQSEPGYKIREKK